MTKGRVIHMWRLGNRRRYWELSSDLANLATDNMESWPVAFSAEPKHLIVDLNRSALVIIDMQNDFCADRGWLAQVGGDVTKTRAPVPYINRTLPVLREQGVPVIWVNWGNRADLANISPAVRHVYKAEATGTGLGDVLPGTSSRVLEKGSWGASLVEGLIVADGDIWVDKYRMSGFWDTPLDSILRNLGVTTIFFAGVNLDQCVMATLQDASFLGYNCVLMKDLCATSSPDFCTEATLYNVKQCYGFVAESESLISGIKESQDKRGMSRVFMD